MRDRLVNILFALDIFMFTLLTLGKAYPFESFSSAAYRAELNGRFYGKARPWIDLLFGPGHCEHAYRNAKSFLPPDQL